MAARQSAEMGVALRLVARGLPLHEAATRAGVSPSALVRARQRHGLPALKRGPKPKAR